MEDSFKVRVDKTFGSLLPSSSTIPSQPIPSSSLWSLTDDELQRNEWPRETDDPVSDNDDDSDFRSAQPDGSFPPHVEKILFSSKDDDDRENQNPNPNPNPNLGGGGGGDLRKESEDDIEELDESDDEEEEDGGEGSSRGVSEASGSGGGGEGVEEDEDVRNRVGMDPTLDFEAEEDEYDKVAVGREKTGDRLFMCDATDYISHVDSCNELPNTFTEASRDPRANHLAAKLRLKEDAEAARSFNSLHVSDQSLPAVSGSESNALNDGNNLKSILKRKEDQVDSKSEKRVRFDSRYRSDDGGEYEVDEIVTLESYSKGTALQEGASSKHQDSSLVPDYIRNPSKYTHYTFDSLTDMNEESNRQAYVEFLNMVKKSKQSEQDEIPADLSQRIVFHPKKKLANASAVASGETDCAMEDSMLRKSSQVIIAAVSEHEDDACEMEVDEQASDGLKARTGKRTARQYRSKLSLEESGSDS